MLDAILLACDGVGTAPSSTTTTGAAYGNNASISGSATTTEITRSHERFMVEIEGERVRVRVPKPLVPTINGGGNAGWWTLDNTRIADDAISGRFRFNAFNKPTVEISRITGDIDVRGSFGFSFQGQCAPAPQGQRLF